MVIVAFVAGASLTALMGVASPPSSDGDLGRIASTIGDPNELAATLAAGFVLAIGASFGAPPASLSRLLLRVAAGLCLLAIVLTLSRGGLVAVAAVGVIAPLLAKHRARATAISLSCLAAAALGFLAFAPAEAVERIQSRDGGSGRTDIWKVAGRMIEDKPVIGIGSGNFPTSSSDYVLQPGALPDKPDLIYKPSVAHNIYLEVWSEVGLVGLLLFGGVIFGCLGCAVLATQRALARDDVKLAALAAGVSLALVALFTAYFFLSEQHGNKLWLLLALGPAMLTIASRPPNGGAAAASGATVTGGAGAPGR